MKVLDLKIRLPSPASCAASAAGCIAIECAGSGILEITAVSPSPIPFLFDLY
jgi:hypothetical protein